MKKSRFNLLKKIVTFMLVVAMVVELFPLGEGKVYAQENPNPVLATQNANGIDYANWLSYMPGDMPISRINMPASHDSGCYEPMNGDTASGVLGGFAEIFKFFAEGMSKTQDYNITIQLLRGVRVFDIRGAYEDSNPEDLMVNHKLPMYRGKDKWEVLRFKHVFKEIDDFLENHKDETVVMVLDSEGIPLFDVFNLGPEKADELITRFCEYGIRRWSKFKYFPYGSKVPTLDEVRGKCVVLSGVGDDSITAYENNYDVSVEQKMKYIQNYFDNHNKKDPGIRSNIGAQYKTDYFKEENYRNHLKDTDRPEGEPMVKLVNFSANKPSRPWPKDVADAVKPVYGKNGNFKSEIRYGWIGNDFIGTNDPTDGVIESNIGGTNYIAKVDSTGLAHMLKVENGDFILCQRSAGRRVSIDLLEKKYDYEVIDNEETETIIVKGLPLYAPNGERYDYKLEYAKKGQSIVLENEGEHAVSDEYVVDHNKWCGRIIKDAFEAKIESITMPLEIQWKYEKRTPVAEPTTRSEFFEICDEIELCQSTVDGDENKIVLNKLWDIPGVPYIQELESKGDHLYRTNIVDLPKYSEKGKVFDKCKINNVVFNYYEISPSANYRWSIEEGTDGCMRIVIEIHSVFNMTDVTGKITWQDGDDVYGIREKLYDDEVAKKGEYFYKLKKTNRDFTSYEFPGHRRDAKGEDEYIFTGQTSKYDDRGDEYISQYIFPEELGPYKRYPYYADKNEAEYNLYAATDLTVVWNLAEDVEIPYEYRTGTPITLNPGTRLYANIKDEEDENVWYSEPVQLRLFETGTCEYKYSLGIESLKKQLNDYGFDVTEDRIMDVDENGYPLQHFVIFCDAKSNNKTIIKGKVRWNDGILKLNHENSDYIRIYEYVDGRLVPIPPEMIEWDGVHFYAELPKYEEDGTTEIQYVVRPLKDDDYEIDCEDDTYNYTYTRLISVNVVDDPEGEPLIESSDIRLTRNGVIIPDSEIKGNNPFIKLPIADENKIPYCYGAEVVPPDGYIVQSIRCETEKESDSHPGDVTLIVRIYKKTDNIEIPVELTVEGINTEDIYKFTVHGLTDEGLLNVEALELSKGNGYKGTFTIDEELFNDASTPYFLSVYQIVGNNPEVDYDEHISYIKVDVRYVNGHKILDTEWGEWIETDDDVIWIPSSEDIKASKFTNKVDYVPATLKLDGIKHVSVSAPIDVTLPSETFTYMLYTIEEGGTESIIDVATFTTDSSEYQKDIVFGKGDNPLYFYNPGTYEMYVKVLNRHSRGWFYNITPYTVEVNVERVGHTNELKVKEIKYDKRLVSSNNTITQTYSEVKYQIPVGKKLIGIDDSTDTFEFVAKDMFDDSIKVNATILGAGKGLFEPITYYEPGTYMYTVREKDKACAEWNCDDSIARYDVTVVRDSRTGVLEIDEEKIAKEKEPLFVNEYFVRSIPVTVFWEDAKDESGKKTFRPEDVSFKIREGGAIVGGSRLISGDKSQNEWTYETERLPYYKMVDGTRQEIDYVIDTEAMEYKIGDNYDISYYGSAMSGFVITCVQKGLRTTGDVSVRVEWDDDNDKLDVRPEEVPISLIPDGFYVDIDTQFASYDNGWRVEFKDLPLVELVDDEKVYVEYEPDPSIVEWYEYDLSFDDNMKEYVIRYRLRGDVELWHEPVSEMVYTGSAIKPEPKVYCGRTRLTKGRDYTVKYYNNVNIGYATITVTGKGNYSGKDSFTFTIEPKSISQEDVYVSIADKVYTGKKLVSKPTIKYGKNTLKEGRDYILKYSDNLKDEGTVTVTITGKGNYEGERIVTYKIYKKKNDFSAVVVDKVPDIIYRGYRVYLNRNELKVYSDKYKTKLLEEGTDYEVTYKNNTNVGKATAVIKGIGDYADYGKSKSVNFSIIPQELTDAKVVITGDTTYTGSNLKPTIEVYADGELVNPKYYTVQYSNNKAVADENAKKAPCITVKGKGNYSKKVSVKFAIKPRLLTADDAELSIVIPNIKDTGKTITEANIKPIIKYGKMTFKRGRDYIINEFSPVSGAVMQTAKITFIGNYIGDVESSVRLYTDTEKINLNSDDFTLTVSDVKYTGKAAKPKYKLIDNITGKVISNKCYSVKYENSVYISDSDPKIILTGKGSYEGTIEKNFRIYERSIAKVYVDKIPNQIYTGKQIEPKDAEIKVYADKKKTEPLTKGTDYIIEYGNNIKKGKGTVIIKGIGEYGGTKKVTFLIVPKGMIWFNQNN